MILEIFTALGLREEDMKVYLNLLETAPSTAGTLVTRMGIPRVTLYGHLDRLCAHGCAKQAIKNNVKVFSAEPGEKLDILFTRRIEELQNKQKDLQTVLPELHAKTGMNLLNPVMQVFEGSEGVQTAMEDILLYPDRVTYAMWPMIAMLDALSAEFLRYHNIERIKRNITILSVWPKSRTADTRRFPFLGSGDEFLRHIRLAPEEVDFSMGYWIYANKVVFISSRAESFGFSIESKELADLLKSQHQLVWNVSEPIDYDPAHGKPFLDDL